MSIRTVRSRVSRRRWAHLAGRCVGRRSWLLLVLGMASCELKSNAPEASPSVWPQPRLAAAFDASGETIFEARTPSDLSEVKVENDATISVAPDGLKVTVSGDDPHLLLPHFAEGKQFILQIAIESPADTWIQLFFTSRDHPEVSEDQSQSLPLKKGKNVVYFQLDQANLIDPLRLDPGTSAGDYMIESVVARTPEKPATP
jgi:hypothetical protein